MKKLLLQTAITALVSTSVASTVVAENNFSGTALGHANLTFQAGSLQPVSAVAASSLNLSFPVLSSLTPSTFKLANKEGAQLNALYDLSSADTTQGCIQFTNIDNTIVGGGLADIDENFNITFDTEALQSNSIERDSIKFLTENGKCGTPSTNTFTVLSEAFEAAKIGSAFTYEKPTTTDGNIALYYRIPKASLLQLKLKDPTGISNKFDYNKVTKLNGELSISVSTTTQ